ncbi:MAG: phosphoglycolate phosphatase [Pseudomonadota bacterium]
MSVPDIRAVLFDLDGTLIDTAPDMIAALNQLRAEHDLAPLPYALARAQVSHGSSGLVRLAFPQAQGDGFEQLRARFLSLYNERVALETVLFPGCPELLAILEERGTPWGIVTNKPGFLTAPLLQALQLSQRAGCVVAGDTLPERKPHPAPLLHAAALLGVTPSHCVYIGDAERDIQAARAATMPVLLASYGYLGPDDMPASWGADAELANPLALLAWMGLDPLLAGHG